MSPQHDLHPLDRVHQLVEPQIDQFLRFVAGLAGQRHCINGVTNGLDFADGMKVNPGLTQFLVSQQQLTNLSDDQGQPYSQLFLETVLHAQEALSDYHQRLESYLSTTGLEERPIQDFEALCALFRAGIAAPPLIPASPPQPVSVPESDEEESADQYAGVGSHPGANPSGSQSLQKPKTIEEQVERLFRWYERADPRDMDY